MEMAKGHRLYIAAPTASFHEQYRRKTEAERIRRATLPRNLEESADAIAEELAGERALPPRNMRGLVRAEAHAINDTSVAEIASLRAKINKLEAFLGGSKKAKPKSSDKGSTNNKKPSSGTNAKKQNFRNGMNKAAASGQATQPRGRAGGPGNVSNAGKRGENKTPSRGKPVGKKASSKTGKRN